MTVSFETPNLCTFLLGLFRFIISQLVNDYYLISFYFNQFHLSTCTRYCISYFIAISCCRRHQFSLLFMYDTLSAIHLQSLGARPKYVFLYFTFKIFPFWGGGGIRTSIYFSLSVHFIIASLLIRLVLHFSGIFSQFNFCCIFFQFEPHIFSYNVTINRNYAIFNFTSPSSSVISHRSPYFVCNFDCVLQLIKP